MTVAQFLRVCHTAALILIVLFAVDRHPARAQDTLPHEIPDLCATATVSAVRSGAWGNPTTWSGGRVPVATDRVQIPAGVALSYDVVSPAPLRCLGIDGGLTFRTDIATRLIAGTIVVRPRGSLTIGTEATPVRAGIRAELVIADEPLDTSSDPEQYGTGLLVFGRLRMHGAAVIPAFARASAEPAAGDRTIALEMSPVGWRPGDRLILPDTRQLTPAERNSYVPQWEYPIVANVTGAQIGIGSALLFAHRGARDGDGTVNFLPHVGNLTRNVVIRSANPNGTRGHVILVGQADVDVRFVGFVDLGRTTEAPVDSTVRDSTGAVLHVGTNQAGRYPLHLHHVMGATVSGAANQFTLIGNVVERSPKWGIVLHDSHYGLVRNNIVHDVLGAAFMTEDGSESFNTLEANFAVRVFGTGGREGEGREGTGFYFRGPNNYVRRNVAANVFSDQPNSGYAYKYSLLRIKGPVRIPAFPGADVMVDGEYVLRSPYALPILAFDGNEAYAGESGFTDWFVGTPHIKYPTAGMEESVIRNLRVWNCYNAGVFQYSVNHVTYDGLVVRGSNPRQIASVGFRGGLYLSRDVTIRNADIQGLRTGMTVIHDTDAPAGSGTVNLTENSLFRNYTNVWVDSIRQTEYPADQIPPRVLRFSNVRFAPYDWNVTGVAQRLPGDFMMAYLGRGFGHHNLIQRDVVEVINYNGVAGDSFRLYYLEQAPDVIVPQTVYLPSGVIDLLGSPAAGLSNAQAWSKYGIAIGGAITPCRTTRPGIYGFACPLR